MYNIAFKQLVDDFLDSLSLCMFEYKISINYEYFKIAIWRGAKTKAKKFDSISYRRGQSKVQCPGCESRMRNLFRRKVS